MEAKIDNGDESDGRTISQRLQYLEVHVDTHSVTITELTTLMDEKVKPALEKVNSVEQDLSGLRGSLIRDRPDRSERYSSTAPRMSIFQVYGDSL